MQCQEWKTWIFYNSEKLVAACCHLLPLIAIQWSDNRFVVMEDDAIKYKKIE
jgi:hypothetical protein